MSRSISKYSVAALAMLSLAQAAMANIRVSQLSTGHGPDHLIRFEVSSSVLAQHPPATGLPIFVIRSYMTPGVTVNLRYVPIAEINGASCIGGGACSGSLGQTSDAPGGEPYSYAAPAVGGEAVEIGISTDDLCYAGMLQGGLPQGCTTAQTGFPAQNGDIFLEFDVFNVVDPTQPLGAGPNSNPTPMDTSKVVELKP